MYHDESAAFDMVEAKLDRIMVRSENNAAYLPWHKIKPISYYHGNDDTEYETPKAFPETCSGFWKFKSPKTPEQGMNLL